MFGLLGKIASGAGRAGRMAMGALGRRGPHHWHINTVHQMRNQVMFGLAVPTAITWATTPPEERVKATVENALTYALTAGMAPGRQMLAMTALAMAPGTGEMLKGVSASYRTGLEARTSLAVPFGHSTLSMDLAFAQMQYATSRINSAYGAVGNEAAFMASRYTNRG